MLFNSLDFLVFFPVVTIAYFAMPHKFRWLWLLIASCYFYMAFVWYYILILGLTISIDYFAGIQIEKSQGRRRKLFLQISVLSTCLILFIFKYFNFFNENFAAVANYFHWSYPIGALSLILPIGLSFHTFQSLSYVFEVYRGNQRAEKNFGIYSLYVMFYPQLVAGPIERPQNLLHQFREPHYFEYERVKSGLLLILWGMFKKVVVADRLSEYVGVVYNHHEHFKGLPVLMAIYCFSVQLYCDFSGYSDIAIGTARVMGFKLMTNFNMPYFSKSISEFWKRWHISLFSWFRDYLYAPLRGKRASKFRKRYSLIITFITSGLWHGAAWNYVTYGTLNGVALVVEESTLKKRKKFLTRIGMERVPKLHRFLQVFITFHILLFFSVFFRGGNIKSSVEILGSIAGPYGFRNIFIPGVKEVEVYLCLFWMISLMGFEKIVSLSHPYVDSYILSKPKLIRWVFYFVIFVSIIILGSFGFNEFIYFQF